MGTRNALGGCHHDPYDPHDRRLLPVLRVWQGEIPTGSPNQIRVEVLVEVQVEVRMGGRCEARVEHH